MVNINFNVTRKYNVNGKEYASIEEMPDDIRKTFEKVLALKAGAELQADSTKAPARIVFNGTDYKNIEAMPPDIRQLFEKTLNSIQTGIASPGVESGASSHGWPQGTRTAPVVRPQGACQPPRTEPLISPRALLISILMAAVILLLYFLFRIK